MARTDHGNIILIVAKVLISQKGKVTAKIVHDTILKAKITKNGILKEDITRFLNKSKEFKKENKEEYSLKTNSGWNLPSTKLNDELKDIGSVVNG